MSLQVWWQGAVVGQVFAAGDGLRFRYARDARRPLSAALPVDGPEERPGTFFANLLPEGAVKARLAARLGVSVENDFALLEAVGGDCAGALSLLPEGASPSATARARRLTPALLARLAEAGPMATLVDEGLRLSLAGAQGKLAVVSQGKALALPGGTAPSTHILKLPSPEWPGLPVNELVMLELGRAAGLPTPAARLCDLGPKFEEPGLLLERFDRATEAGQVRRLHQEDLCQATGRSPALKYEAQGGPTLAEVVALLRKECARPALDIERLLRWQIFNVLCGNADGHGKNLALVREPVVALAPAYDLVCTRQWGRLSPKLALSVGGAFDPGHVGPRAWAACADACGVSRDLVFARVRQAHEELPALVTDTVKALRAGGVRGTALQVVPRLVTELCRRSARLFATEKPGPKLKRR
jgi:serine/threonine-protein kinase HipA